MRACPILVLCGIVWVAPIRPAAILAAGDDAVPGRPVVVAAGEPSGPEPCQPQAAIDARGRIFVTFGVGNAIRCARSDDQGRTYSVAPVGSPGVLSLGMRRGPRIAVAGERVVISAVGGAEGQGRDGDLMAWRSTDGGQDWGDPVRVNAVAGAAREGLHAMAAGPTGSVFCAWLDLRDGRTELRGARSSDAGRTWEPDRLVYRAPGGNICECCHPSVAVGPGGDVVVMWRNQVRGARDMYFLTLPDGGATLGAAAKLGAGTWPLNACPMDGGAVTIGPGGQVVAAWMRQGSVFEARPGEPEHRLGPGVQPWTAIGPGGAYSVWLAARPGRLMARIPGRPGPIVLAEQASDPVVVAGAGGQGPVLATWEVKPGGKVMALVLAPATIGPGR